jgi:N-acetylglucosamine malate deacetylase 1
MKNMVFAVHPDDETLGAGGTLVKLKSLGDENYWCILTGMGAAYSKEKIESRKLEIEKVKTLFGFKKVYQLPFEAAKLDSVPRIDLVSALENCIKEVKPERIFIPFKYDSHSDHKIAYQALSVFFKSFRYPFVKEIYIMETISETDFSVMDVREKFNPNCFFDVTEQFDQKINILKVYASELGEHPFPRSLKTIESLARYRGSLAGVDLAEAFMLIKKIN